MRLQVVEPARAVVEDRKQSITVGGEHRAADAVQAVDERAGRASTRKGRTDAVPLDGHVPDEEVVMVVELERHQVRLVEQVAGHGPAAVEPPARDRGAAGFDESRSRRD